jgi:hypothetical protein
MFKMFMASQPLAPTYPQLYRLSCLEENMSPVPTNVHPDLHLREPKRSELRRAVLGGILPNQDAETYRDDDGAEDATPGVEIEDPRRTRRF